MKTGYHLEFVEDIDEKLEKLTDTLARREGNRSFSKDDKDLLKKIFKAEVVTQFPDLGGKIEKNNENEFQGAINVRRVTPNKEIGIMKSTGAGEKTTEDDLKEENLEDKEITYEKWGKLHTKGRTKVYLKGSYNFLGKQESEEGITSKISTMLSKIEGIDRSVYLSKGEEVYYTGETFTFENNTYIEVAKEKEAKIVVGYIKNVDAEKPKVITNQEENQGQEETSQEQTAKKTIGEGNKNYTIAIAAGHNTADDKGYTSRDGKWIEEELTQEVAKEVENLFLEYENITIKQTGSTESEDVKEEERTKKAKQAKPDLCIQIYFNSGNGQESGVEVCYEEGDGASEKLAGLLSQEIAKKMDLDQRELVTGEGTSDYYKIIDSSAETGFPSVITKGCFLDNPKDIEVLKKGGVKQYAKGIQEACIEYLTSYRGDDEIIETEQNDTYSRTESRIYDLTYVSPEEFQGYIDTTNKKALEVYTLDDDFNLITATWEKEGDTASNASLSIKSNAGMNFRTILDKTTMPYEYLLLLLINTEREDFVTDLADVVINETEIVIAVQDNVTTTISRDNVQQTTRIISDTGEHANQYAVGWHDVPEASESSFSEYSSSSISITYAKTWFMTYSKGNAYSYESLGVENGKKVDLIKNVKGKVSETKTTSYDSWNEDGSGGKRIREGTATYRSLKKGGTSLAEDASGENIEEHTYTYEIYERRKTFVHTISNQYEDGEAVVSGDTSQFIKLFNKHKMGNSININWLEENMAQNEKTANLVDLTKYMTYQVTKIDEGVTDFDFDIFNYSKFEDAGSAMGGLDTFKEYLHYWENGSGAPTNADGTKYKVEDDGAGHPTVGYGVDIHNSGYLNRFIAAGYDISMGAYIDKDFVDAIEDEEIQKKIQDVESRCSGLNLTQYQKYALVSRAYNCGTGGAFKARNGKTFVEAYKSYWNQEKDDEYRVAKNDGMYNHALYQNYMKDPQTSEGRYMRGLERRRKSEWILFKTGYYDAIDKWCSQSSSGEGGTIVEKAVECHQYLRTNGFSYGQVGRNIPIKGSSRKIDCSSFVSWVLYEAGYDGFKGYQKTSSTFNANKWGWQKIPTSQAQPGDILCYSGHVEIVAASGGGNKFRVYNCRRK